MVEFLLSLPICRGSNGMENRQADWQVVGTGRRLKKVKEWNSNQSFPADWKSRLGHSFIEDMMGTKWQFYCCPFCQSSI